MVDKIAGRGIIEDQQNAIDEMDAFRTKYKETVNWSQNMVLKQSQSKALSAIHGVITDIMHLADINKAPECIESLFNRY